VQVGKGDDRAFFCPLLKDAAATESILINGLALIKLLMFFA